VRGLPRWRHSPGHRCAESPGARRPRRAHWAPAVLGPGGGWRGRRACGPADAPGRVRDGHGHVRAPHHREHRPQPAGPCVTAALGIAAVIRAADSLLVAPCERAGCEGPLTLPGSLYFACNARYTFSAVTGSSVMLTPVASSTALAIAGATAPMGCSP